MSRDEWFRSETWNDAAREAFEARLSRSRTPFHRAQYLFIQGQTLTSTGRRREVTAGRALLERVISGFPDEVLEVAGAHYALGESFVDSDPQAAIRHFRACLSLEQGRSFNHGTELRLAETLLNDDPTAASLHEAAGLLDKAEAEAFFHVERWRIAVARARLHARQGDSRGAATHAKRALALLADNKPKLPRHPTVGLIEPDRKTVTEMRKLAS